MKKINNKYFMLFYKDNLHFTIFFAILIVISLSLSFYFHTQYKNEIKDRVNYTSLDLHDRNNIGKYVYIDLNEKPYLLGTYNKNYDDNMYMIKIDEKYYLLVSLEDVDNIDSNNPIRLYGYTREPYKAIKESALHYINSRPENYNLKEEDFDNFFGYMYLDSITGSMNEQLYQLFLILPIIFFCLFVYGLYYIIIFKKNLRKLSQEEIDKLNNEINDKEAVFYCGLFLCNSYLIDTISLKFYNYYNIHSIYFVRARYNSLIIYIKTIDSYKIKKISRNNALYFTKIPANENGDNFEKYLKKKNPNIDIVYTNEFPK